MHLCEGCILQKKEAMVVSKYSHKRIRLCEGRILQKKEAMVVSKYSHKRIHLCEGCIPQKKRSYGSIKIFAQKNAFVRRLHSTKKKKLW
jgi:hypothetical protein